MVSDCIILLICFRIFDITIFCKKIVVYELKMFTSHKPQMAVEWETKGMFEDASRCCHMLAASFVSFCHMVSNFYFLCVLE